MSTLVADPQELTSTGSGQDFGRCPVCEKPLRPRCKITGEPRTPPVNAGFESRAKCGGCGAIIAYMGGGEWRVVTEAEMRDGDPLERLGY